jgi:hypothetical protein
VLAAAAGIGVLAWGALRSDDSGGTSTAAAFTDLALPPLPAPITAPTLTREQALVKAGLVGDVHAVVMEVTRMDGALSLQSGLGSGLHTSTTWVVRYRTFADPCAGLPSCGPAPVPPNTISTAIACREWTRFLLDGSEPPPGDSAFGPTGGGTGGQPLPDEACKTQSSSDLAVVLSWRAISEELESYSFPKSVAVKQTSLSEAVDSVRSAGISAEPQQGNDTGDVWLVTISGRLALPTNPTAVPETPQPTPVMPCRVAMAIVSGHTVLAYGSASSTDC